MGVDDGEEISTDRRMAGFPHGSLGPLVCVYIVNEVRSVQKLEEPSSYC